MISLMLDLFWTFFVIGIFTFGGGGAMISLIQAQVVTQHHWLSEESFANIVAVSQTTPGPIGVNAATYVGYQTFADAGYSHLAGIAASAVSTFALVLPSFIIFFLMVRFYSTHRANPVFSGVMRALKPATAGLIGAAALVLMFHISIRNGLCVEIIRGNFVDWRSWALAAAAFSLAMWTKVSPILIILLSGFLGLLIF